MRFIPSSAQATDRRSGMILLVVMAMLALFAAVALSFVFYADSEAFAAQMARQSMTKEQPYVDPEALAGFFLNQLIYDTDNTYSSLRGWSLARSLYGWNPNTLNFTPYNGIGRDSLATDSVVFPNASVSGNNLVNYQKYSVPNWNNTTNYVVGNFVLSGGNFYVCIAQNKNQTPPNATFWTLQMADPLLNKDRTPEFFGRIGDANYRYVGGANPPWTAYDTNSMFLAEVTATGTVLLPSFARPWNANGVPSPSPALKYVSLRPDPNWHPMFGSLPDSDGPNGPDVRNLDVGAGGAANNDSIWIDLGYPVMTAPNGKRYKVLFAPLVVDLSNRLHLWAHGNNLGTSGPFPSVSNMGLGAPEVNITRLPGLNFAEWANLVNLKYGAGNIPLGTPTFMPGTFASKIDPNGFDPSSKGSTQPFTGGFTLPLQVAVAKTTNGPVQVAALSNLTLSPPMPGGLPWAIQKGTVVTIDTGANAESMTVASVTPPNTFTTTTNFTKDHLPGVPVAAATFFPFPQFPSGWDNGTVAESVPWPLGFNLRRPTAPNIAPLRLSNQEALMRYGATNSPALTSELFRRMPLTFANASARNMVTLRNTYFDRIAASPFIPYDPTTPAANLVKYQLPYPAANAPSLTGAILPPAYNTPINLPTKSEYTTEPNGIGFGWRSNLGQMLRVNLNRALPDYPLPTLVLNAAEPNSKVIDTTNAGVVGLFNAAQAARQQFALDIYNALIRVTGAQDPNASLPANVSAASPDYLAARWLAQLSVNIVDYIDNDDYSTPFNWNATAAANSGGAITSEFVFGTELPRVVLNEALAMYDNDPNEASLLGAVKTSTTGKLNVWAELHNPFATATGTYPLDGSNAKLQLGANAVYQVAIYNWTAAASANMRTPGNNLGDPDYLVAPGATTLLSTSSTWGANSIQHEVLPANGKANGTTPILVSTITAGGASEAANTVTITTAAAHNLSPGQTVVIAGVGVPEYNGTYQVVATPTATTFTYTNPTMPLAASGSGTVSVGNNDGYYVLGPAVTFLPARDPGIPSTNATGEGAMSKTLAAKPVGTMLLLRRLAVPHLPPQPAPGLPLYNPYITVDYLDNIAVWDNRQYDVNGMIAGAPPPDSFYSFGRKQPYSAYNNPAAPAQSQVVTQFPGFNPVPKQPRNTFYFANAANPANIDTPFAWLTHLDRPLVNTLELRHVSAFKPHELTQQFITYPGGVKKMFQHRTAWGATAMSGNLLHRALDVLGTPNYMLGNYRGGRWQGNINLNTLTEPPIFAALCDSQFPIQTDALITTTDVSNIFSKLITSRNPLPGPTSPLQPNSEGNPFKPLSNGDVSKTWLRPDPTSAAVPAPGLFNVGITGEHPYRREALLQKIYNNITTTSNVFGVYCTVGYFEVLDETVRPQRLGAEIGRAEGRHIRNRFFAIVDRTGMQLFNGTSSAVVAAGTNVTMSLATVNTGTGAIAAWNANQNYLTSNTVTYLGNAYICIQAYPANAAILPINTAYWLPILQPGMLLEVDTGANAEVVVVKTVTGTSFTADFTLPHAAGVSIVCRGNPGPRATYNPRQDAGVVLHMSVIQ